MSSCGDFYFEFLHNIFFKLLLADIAQARAIFPRLLFCSERQQHRESYLPSLLVYVPFSGHLLTYTT